MLYRFRFLAIVLAFPLACSITAQSPVLAKPRAYARNISPGIQLYEWVDGSVPLSFMAIKANLREKGVRLKAYVANDCIRGKNGNAGARETVGSAAARYNAAAGVNADFFPWTADPLGLTIVDGNIVSEPYPNRPSMGLTSEGKIIFGNVRFSLTFENDGRYCGANGINKPATLGEMIVYTPLWAQTTGVATATSAEAVIKIDWQALTRTGEAEAKLVQFNPAAQDSRIPEDCVALVANGPKIRELADVMQGQGRITARLRLQEDSGRSWLGVTQAVSGGSWLVKDLKLAENGKESGFDGGFVNKRHPRTAAGVTKNGSLLLVVIDGRQVVSRGATLQELAQTMLANGCTDAINLDGGGSSTMIARNILINSPSDGRQRPVASGLLLFGDDLPNTAGAVAITASAGPMSAGQSRGFQLTKPDGSALSKSEMDAVIWGTENGGGFVEQNGVFTALKPGNAVVKAWLPGQVAQSSVQVNAAEGREIKLAWGAQKASEPEKRELTILVKDSLGNVMPFAEVEIKVTGGMAEPSKIACGADGLGHTVISWNASDDAGRRDVEVFCGGYSAKITP